MYRACDVCEVCEVCVEHVKALGASACVYAHMYLGVCVCACVNPLYKPMFTKAEVYWKESVRRGRCAEAGVWL